MRNKTMRRTAVALSAALILCSGPYAALAASPTFSCDNIVTEGSGATTANLIHDAECKLGRADGFAGTSGPEVATAERQAMTKAFNDLKAKEGASYDEAKPVYDAFLETQRQLFIATLEYEKTKADKVKQGLEYNNKFVEEEKKISFDDALNDAAALSSDTLKNNEQQFIEGLANLRKETVALVNAYQAALTERKPFVEKLQAAKADAEAAKAAVANVDPAQDSAQLDAELAKVDSAIDVEPSAQLEELERALKSKTAEFDRGALAVAKQKADELKEQPAYTGDAVVSEHKTNFDKALEEAAKQLAVEDNQDSSAMRSAAQAVREATDTLQKAHEQREKDQQDQAAAEKAQALETLKTLIDQAEAAQRAFTDAVLEAGQTPFDIAAKNLQIALDNAKKVTEDSTLEDIKAATEQLEPTIGQFELAGLGNITGDANRLKTSETYTDERVPQDVKTAFDEKLAQSEEMLAAHKANEKTRSLAQELRQAIAQLKEAYAKATAPEKTDPAQPDGGDNSANGNDASPKPGHDTQPGDGVKPEGDAKPQPNPGANGGSIVLPEINDSSDSAKPEGDDSKNTVKPNIVLDKLVASVGGEVTVVVNNLTPLGKVRFILHSDPVFLGEATADSAGKVTFTFKIPRDVATGEHQVIATDVTSHVSVSTQLTVTHASMDTIPAGQTETSRVVPSTGATASKGEKQVRQLAKTGADTSLLAFLAGLFALTGAAVTARRARD